MKLNLRMAMKSPEDIEYSDEIDSDEEIKSIDGVKLEKLNKWLSEETLVGRMIKYLYECEDSITFSEFKRGVKYDKSEEEFINNIDNGRGVNCRHGKLWNYKNKRVTLNKKIRKYMDKIKNKN